MTRDEFHKDAEERLIGRKLKPEEAISSPKHDHMRSPISPAHYVGERMEVIDVIDAFNLDAYEANIVKYVLRYKKKNGIEDLKKAQWYLNRMIQKKQQKEPPF